MTPGNAPGRISVSHMNRRRALQLLAALGTTGLVAGCGTDDDGETITDGSPIKIGMIAPESGAGKAVGQDMVNGFELYLSMHDQRLGGHPVTLEKRDEGESFNEFVDRTGFDQFEELISDLKLPVEFSADNLLFFIDWNRSEPYKVERGEGECAI